MRDFSWNIFGYCYYNNYICVVIKNENDMTKLDDLRKLGEVIEPYDPDYLNDKPYEVPDLSSYEKRFLHKISILENKLKRKGVRFEWVERWECFRIKKYVLGSDYPTYRYIRVNMDENDYSFGTEELDLVFDGKASVIVDAAVRWLNSKVVRK